MNNQPWMTNAHHNRKQAVRMFNAGFSAKEIAREFPLAFRSTPTGLALHYDEDATRALHQRDPLAAEHGLKEMSLMVSSQAVTTAIKRKG